MTVWTGGGAFLPRHGCAGGQEVVCSHLSDDCVWRCPSCLPAGAQRAVSLRHARAANPGCFPHEFPLRVDRPECGRPRSQPPQSAHRHRAQGRLRAGLHRNGGAGKDGGHHLSRGRGAVRARDLRAYPGADHGRRPGRVAGSLQDQPSAWPSQPRNRWRRRHEPVVFRAGPPAASRCDRDQLCRTAHHRGLRRIVPA